MHLNDGSSVTAGAVFCLISVILLVFMIRQFRRKPPLLDPLFLAQSAEEEKLRSPRAFREAGNLFFFGVAVSLFLGLALIFDSGALAMIAAVLALGAVLRICMLWVSRT